MGEEDEGDLGLDFIADLPLPPEFQAERAAPCSLEYWEQKARSFEPLDAMLLDPQAKKFQATEREEVLRSMQQATGRLEPSWVVADLGAGIGRYTEVFAQSCARVTALDLVASFIEENRKANENAGRNNVDYVVADASKHEFAHESLDLLFSSWLLMYFSDADARAFAQRAFHWVRPSKWIFFRESCHVTVGGTAPRTTSAAKYRDPEFYRRTFLDAGFELVAHGNVKVYERRYNNPHQYWWAWRRPEDPPTRYI